VVDQQPPPEKCLRGAQGTFVKDENGTQVQMPNILGWWCIPIIPTLGRQEDCELGPA
jgi:hypothetical protein